MSLDATKIQFTTLYQVDKIAMYSTTTDGSGDGIGGGGSLAVGTASPASPAIYIATIANPYGRKCLTTMSWSLDKVNFYPMNVPIYYYNAVHAEYAWQALGFAGCSDSLIYIACTTQYDVGAQTMYVQFAMDSPT